MEYLKVTAGKDDATSRYISKELSVNNNKIINFSIKYNRFRAAEPTQPSQNLFRELNITPVSRTTLS